MFYKVRLLYVDCLPKEMKTDITAQIKEHIEWLSPKDHLQRATNGFKSLISFMNGKDNTKHLQKFRDYTNKLDPLEMKVFTMYLNLQD